MASTPPTPANLTCGHCGFVNEAERVYCHNCGSKLDRSVLPQAEEQKERSPEKERKRIEQITNPKTGIVFQEIKTLLKVELYAVLAAALIVIALKPEDVPEAKKQSGEMRLVSSDMMEAIQSAQPRAISFSEDDVNEYLKKQVKPGETMIPGVDVTRTYVAFTPGLIRIGTEYSVWGYPIFTDIYFRVEFKEGKFTTPIAAGNFGRLQIDPRLMEYGEMIFQSTWDSLKRERAQMDRMSAVDIKKGQITLITKGLGR